MSETLKERHEIRKIENLKKRLTSIDQDVIIECVNDGLIVEAIDKHHIDAALDIFAKLRAINFFTLESLAKARDLALEDVAKVLGDKKDDEAVKEITKLFAENKDNPVSNCIIFTSALQNLSYAVSTYAASKRGDEKAIFGQKIVQKFDVDFNDLAAIKNLDDESQQELNYFQTIVNTEFKPDARLASIAPGWLDKYMGGKDKIKTLAQEFVKSKASNVRTITSKMINSFSNSSSVAREFIREAEQSTLNTTGTTGTEQAKSTKATGGTAGTKPGVAKRSEDAKYLDKVAIQGSIRKIFRSIGVKGAEAKTVTAAIKYMNKNNLLDFDAFKKHGM